MVKPIALVLHETNDSDSPGHITGHVLKIGGAIVLAIPVQENTYEKYKKMPDSLRDNDHNTYHKRSWHRECTIYIGDVNVRHIPCTFARVIEWTRGTFPVTTNQSLCAHLQEEFNELNLALINHTNPQEEVADITILLMDMCAINGWDFDQVVLDKLAICKTRTWEKPDAQGVTRHVK